MIFDPLRKKNVALTPEERVRQWFIGVLHENMGVPIGLMMSEVGMKFGQVQDGIHGGRQKTFRADILVYDRKGKPLLVVECKRPEVAIDSEVLGQVLKYGALLGVRFIAVTNGTATYIAGKDGEGKLHFLSEMPGYEEMTRYE
jgi:type I site-specific restriction endonuclease